MVKVDFWEVSRYELSHSLLLNAIWTAILSVITDK
jgi:hypothetical protein